ncbi:het domain containing protein, partial [Colletotrichum musicola]
MRLINTATLALEEFFGDNIPPYAILSHVWGPEEVTFQDWQDLAKAREKQGFQKIELARNQALANDLGWLWVDTNCINKESSAELSEAVNSMFAWYRDAEYCYAYLADVSEAGDPDEAVSKRHLFPRISRSRWFTRGWTLQELLAPRSVFFFSREWRQVGTRKSLADVIAGAAHIRAEYLYNGKKRKGNSRLAISGASVAERMSWLSRRETTRAEDMAYCMLGIFDINMPLLYGEGNRAFTRLQEEILKTSTDETLFSWSWSEDDP